MNKTLQDQKELSGIDNGQLISTLKERFNRNMQRHRNVEWAEVQAKLESNISKLISLDQMEITGGEPDVVDFITPGQIIFCDCSLESPIGRRSLCFDGDALESRKENKPKNSAMDVAEGMGIEMLSEEQYRALQQTGSFDNKTSSWIQTPQSIRKLGGALFCDRRYNTVFVYHNGAESYYAARGFRGLLRL